MSTQHEMIGVHNQQYRLAEPGERLLVNPGGSAHIVDGAFATVLAGGCVTCDPGAHVLAFPGSKVFQPEGATGTRFLPTAPESGTAGHAVDNDALLECM